MKELTRQPPPFFSSENITEMVEGNLRCLATPYLPLCRKTENRAQDAVAGGLPSLVLEFGEVRQLLADRCLAAAVFPRTQLLVQKQTNIVCFQHLRAYVCNTSPEDWTPLQC